MSYIAYNRPGYTYPRIDNYEPLPFGEDEDSVSWLSSKLNELIDQTNVTSVVKRLFTSAGEFSDYVLVLSSKGKEVKPLSEVKASFDTQKIQTNLISELNAVASRRGNPTHLNVNLDAFIVVGEPSRRLWLLESHFPSNDLGSFQYSQIVTLKEAPIIKNSPTKYSLLRVKEDFMPNVYPIITTDYGVLDSVPSISRSLRYLSDTREKLSAQTTISDSAKTKLEKLLGKTRFQLLEAETYVNNWHYTIKAIDLVNNVFKSRADQNEYLRFYEIESLRRSVIDLTLSNY